MEWYDDSEQANSMGIDGNQTLTIRGPKAYLDVLESSGLLFEVKEHHPNWFASVQDDYFGPKNVTMTRCEDTMLEVSFAFRNKPMNEYFEALMNMYPHCWMKNTFDTETGWCGFWIGRFVEGRLEVQTHEWQELSWEEMAEYEHFSED